MKKIIFGILFLIAGCSSDMCGVDTSCGEVTPVYTVYKRTSYKTIYVPQTVKTTTYERCNYCGVE